MKKHLSLTNLSMGDCLLSMGVSRHLSATNLIVGDEEAIVSCEPEHGGVKKHFSPTNKLVLHT